MCEQSVCPYEYVRFPEIFGKYKIGNCPNQGYTLLTGKENFKVPIWGYTVTIEKYYKPSPNMLAEEAEQP